MEYRCVTTSVEGFVQQLAVAYITHGYWFYVAGSIPERKDPTAIDAKLIHRYGIGISKWARYRRKKQGLANMQYLRHDRFFVLLATKGRHEFFERECGVLRDVRRVPIKFGGYSIGCRRGNSGEWRASVRIEHEEFVGTKAMVVAHALWHSAREVGSTFATLRHQPYAPIRQQLMEVWRAVNRARRTAALEQVPIDVVPWKRRIVGPFAQRSATQMGMSCPSASREQSCSVVKSGRTSS